MQFYTKCAVIVNGFVHIFTIGKKVLQLNVRLPTTRTEYATAQIDDSLTNEKKNWNYVDTACGKLIGRVTMTTESSTRVDVC